MIGKTPNEGERLKRIEEMLENIGQQIDDMSERLLGNLEEELKAYLDLKLDELLGDITTRIELIPTFDDPTNEIDKQIHALHSTIGDLQRTMGNFVRGWIELLRRTGA